MLGARGSDATEREQDVPRCDSRALGRSAFDHPLDPNTREGLSSRGLRAFPGEGHDREAEARHDAQIGLQ